MLRSGVDLYWRCCGVVHHPTYRYCPGCGNAVMNADRVLLRFPIVGGGDIAVVANAEPDAETWRMLVKMAELTAATYERRAERTAEANATEHPAEPTPSAVNESSTADNR